MGNPILLTGIKWVNCELVNNSKGQNHVSMGETCGGMALN